VEVVSKRTDSKLVGFGVLSCLLQVSCKCAKLKSERVPFVKGKQRYRIRREGYDTSQSELWGILNQPIMVSSLYLSDSVLSLL